MPVSTQASILRFGAFELDLRSGELRNKGIRIKLQQQPLQVLTVLLRHPGEVVTREALRSTIWPADTFVDFDNSLNTAINKLRDALGDSSNSPRFIETLPRRGYRFVTAVTKDEPVVTAVPKLVAAAPTRIWKPSALLTVCIAALGLAAVGALLLRSLRTGQIDSIAVLPFINETGDTNSEYFSDGVTESLIGNLAHVPHLKVKSRNSAFRYKGKDVDVQKVGKDLDVSVLVTGRVMARGGTIEISAELTDVRDNTEIWGQHYSGKSVDLISLQQQITGDIVERLRSKLSTSERQQVTNQSTQNPEAYEFYLKGRYYWNKRTAMDLKTAISYFNQAVAKDPGYALAYSGLADAYGTLASYGGSPSENIAKSNAAARKALELDAILAHPHAVLGCNEMEYEWDLAGGEAELKKSLELDPNDATTHGWYAYQLGMMGGREQKALAEANRAHQLDPLSPIISVQLGLVHIMARQFDEAIALCQELATENSTFAQAHYCLAEAYWGKRMYPQTIEQWKALGQLSGDRNDSDFASALERGFRTAGWKRALAESIETLQEQRKNGYSSAYFIASLYADLGENDQAFRWLHTAYEERDLYLARLKTDFSLDLLRSDPRWTELVTKMGLPQQ